MEEQRQRQEDEQRRALAESDPTAAAAAAAVSSASGTTTASASVEPNSEEAMLQRALALSTETPVKRPRVRTNVLLSFQKFVSSVVQDTLVFYIFHINKHQIGSIKLYINLFICYQYFIINLYLPQ